VRNNFSSMARPFEDVAEQDAWAGNDYQGYPSGYPGKKELSRVKRWATSKAAPRNNLQAANYLTAAKALEPCQRMANN
jgi:hypothetical protein